MEYMTLLICNVSIFSQMFSSSPPLSMLICLFQDHLIENVEMDLKFNINDSLIIPQKVRKQPSSLVPNDERLTLKGKICFLH